jgi:hypothetical protein
MWEEGKPADDHPYLQKKGYSGEDLRVTSREYRFEKDVVTPAGTLLIPATDLYGAFQGVERIFPDLSRDKAHRGGKSRCYYGDKPEDGKPLYLVEGWATREAVKRITGGNTAVVEIFGLSCMTGFAKAVKERYPNVELVFCPDKPGSEEQRKIVESLKQYGAVVELPEDREKNTDWDDELRKHGIEPAKALFREAWSKATVKQPETPEEKISLRSFRQNIEPTRGQKPEMIGGIFPRGGVSVMAGQQGTGKSLLMQKFCSDVSLGGEILDGVSGYAAKRKTVYFVGELPVNTMNDRQRTAEWKQNPDNLILYSRITFAKKQIPLDLDDGEGFQNVAEIIMDEKPDIVVFDSLMSFLSCDESDMKAMQGAFTKMVRLADDLQCSVVVVHHIRKRKALERANRLHMDDIIGSSIITRNASLAIGAEKLKTDDGEEMVYVSNLKSWYAPLDEFAFKIIRDDYKVFRGIEIDLNPKNPVVNKMEAIEHAVFKGHEDGSDFTVTGIAKVTGATDRYVRRLFREWEESGRIVSKGGSKNTSYSIMQKFRNDIQSLGMTEKDSGTSVPESSGILEEEHCANCIPELPVPESFPVIATAQGSFRNYTMMTGGVEKTEVYNPSDGESRQGNLEPFFPGGLKTGISSPRGYSVSELATLGGVSVEAVQEELDRWKKCGRLKEDGEKVIILEGTRYPGDDQEPPEDEEPVSAPKGPPKNVVQPEPLSLDALEAWAASVSPGMTGRIRMKAKREKASYETLLRQEYESSGQGEQEPKKGVRLPAPSKTRYIGMKDVSLSDALAWAAGVPGLVQRLKAEADERDDPVMGDSAHWYESLVRSAYAEHLMEEPEMSDLPGQGEKELARNSYMSIFEGSDDEED